MQFGRRDADNWACINYYIISKEDFRLVCAGKKRLTILKVQLLDVECELALLDHIPIEFVPVAQGSEPRAWICGKRAEIETIDA